MNRTELAEEIKRLNKVEKISLELLSKEDLIFHSNKYDHLRESWIKENKVGKEKWHQFVRFVLTPTKEWEYMYERLARLLVIHRNSVEDYFLIDSDNQIMPDRKNDLVRFSISYKKFFQIYSQIINKMQVEHPKIKKNDQKLKGKINWKETLLKSKTKFPINFETVVFNRNFVTPENILLFLCIRWLNKDAKKIINEAYTESLEPEEIHILNEVETKTGKLLQNFPYKEIKNSSKKFLKFSSDDAVISKLTEKIKLRLMQGEIKNSTYLELLGWLSEFNQLGLQNWSGKKTKFHVNSLHDLDTMYEAWIFLEMINFIKRKNSDVKIVFRKSSNEDTFIEFKISGHKVIIYYEKKFDETESMMIKHVPDFSIFFDGELIAVLDAKNYKKNNAEKTMATEKMMSYMFNLNSSYGALIFPNFDTQIIKNPFREYKNKNLAHLRMKPVGTEEEIHEKNKSLEKIFSIILSSIEIKV